ncbi:serine protease [Micromonospora yasonensis]|uniref:S1 family peptidase n=1 Tax=Micromonospora yasonensis TaxID=1128667 RepID=UPI00222FA5BF|nr:serine protease [Micromonospora yasonensis]MCW3839160.1 serine protease [Micromonospora yasonensis]
MAVDGLREAAWVGKVIASNGEAAGTCFQVDAGYIVTAYHVVAHALSRTADENVGTGEHVWFAALGAPLEDRHIATVLAVDEVHDLAVLRSEHTLPASISHLALSDIQAPGTEFLLTGVGNLAEGVTTELYGRLNARGNWDGTTQDPAGRVRASGTATATEHGMSGCPVVRTHDGAVIGVLSERYESASAWSRGRVWIARIENLLALLPSDVSLPVQRVDRSVRQARSNALVQEHVDRIAVSESPYFMEVPEWGEFWSKGVTALRQGHVLIVSGPPGFGVTTFAERLLSLACDRRIEIIRLEPEEWEAPSVAAIPAEPWRAYVLNLRDPEHDQPKEGFVQDLADLGEELKELQSRLVITVTDGIWNSVGARMAPNLCRVRLNSPPNPVELVKHYFKMTSPALVDVVGAGSVARHLEGMNAVQAVQSVANIRHWIEFETADGASVHELVEKISTRLDDHLDTLNVLFGDAVTAPGRLSTSATVTPASWCQPLAVHDRCLILTLAFKGSARLAQVEADSRRLLSRLGGMESSRKSAALGSLDEIFARPGLRGRLAHIGAEVTSGEIVRFRRPTMAGATVRYVWDNYSDMRPAIVDWLVDLADLSDGTHSAEEWLADLVVRNQDVDFIKNTLKRTLANQEREGILVEVLLAALEDEHMRRQCERLLYYWADQSDLQRVVVKVAKGYFLRTQQEIALRRIQRVADSPKAPTQVLELTASSFAEFVRRVESREAFREVVGGWIRSSPTKRSSLIGFAALLGCEGGLEWLLSLRSSGVLVSPLLVELFSSPLGQPALIALLTAASREIETYNQVLDCLAEAIQKEGRLATILALPKALEGVAMDANPIVDLSARLHLSLVDRG